MPASKKGIIKSSQSFWKLSDTQADRIAELCHEEEYKAGIRIFNAGERAQNLYIIESGKVAHETEIRIGSRTRKQATIDIMTSGQIFGFAALIERPVFTMSAVAVEDTKVLALSGERLHQLCDEDHDLYRKIMNEVVNLLRDMLESTKRTLAHVLSVTSHDLRAPLATVQSCLDVIVGGFAGEINDKQRDLISGSKQRISDLTNMIDNILDISYIEIREADFENLALPGVMKDSIGDVEGIARSKRIKIENNVPEDLSVAFGLPKRLRQVFTNLLSNAVKFTPEGGTVSASSLETDDFVQMEIADTGVGISPEDLPRIFDDFYRGMKTDESEGAGIGLSIAKKIVDAHGGRIWAESPNPDSASGTKFKITLPKVSLGVKSGLKKEGEVIKEAKILITDDDPTMLNATAVVLQSRGYNVITARNGAEALAKIAEEKPDLLILDLLMPVMDGFEVVKRLNEQWDIDGERIPILVLSAVKEESSRRRYELETKVSLDVDGYIEKPVSPPLLLQRVEKTLKEGKSVGATSFTVTKGGKQ